MLSEEELVKAVARGEEFALEILFEQHYEGLWKYTLTILKNEEDAREAVNETFFRAFRYARDFQGRGSFSAWLFRVARNLSLDYLKKRKDHIQVVPDIPLPGERRTENPLKEKLLEEIKNMKDEYREVIILMDISGYSVREISLIMNMSPSGVKTLHHRAIKQLRERCKSSDREVL